MSPEHATLLQILGQNGAPKKVVKNRHLRVREGSGRVVPCRVVSGRVGSRLRQPMWSMKITNFTVCKVEFFLIN